MSRIGAVVTGHSRGLGAAIAAALLGRGIAVLGLSRSGNATLAAGSAKANFHEVGLDLSDLDAVMAWLADGELGRTLADCDTVLLVNNAGTLQPMGPLARQDLAAVARAGTLNVTVPLVLASAVVQATPRAHAHRILHISSGAGRHPYAGWAVYCATKAALDQHARTVDLDASTTVRICALAPGVINTAMQSEIRRTSREDFPQRERFEEMHRDGELLDPAEVAVRVVDVLLSDAFGSEPVADLRG